MSKDWLPGLDEYYQPPDPPEFVPGKVSWAEEIALEAFLESWDEALDFEDILKAVTDDDTHLARVHEQLEYYEGDIATLIRMAASNIKAKTNRINAKYETYVNRLMGACEAYVHMVNLGSPINHELMAGRIKELMNTIDNLKGK